mmetsp:Transcript_57150/g.121501  ORF Transcript_57150/g.121501 Transcript_57150/m.121501 type:complete len:552 (+) Transcript_57150:311-1966(+)|eukprot:CAMPEP_0206477926 /NCGR_PEP_ID=MMETSP0324_2-20121206/35731_1 /ASSEMBLY_ACC=CAM_ASM_000836 /TAXON_ID=2866 /ORGANISM="Crypthecodinium cohnii, Strain Seligo" /LENGTH=551 /DNA_ID=CAMNT_0053954099 /DNA_START=225 /DNA_END=1880 /DNA_ORIENTATION=-
MAASSSARENFVHSQSLHATGKADEALAAVKEAESQFLSAQDQVGYAEALRLRLGLALETLELSRDEALAIAKEEASKVRKNAPDGRLADALMSLVLTEVHFYRGESDKALRTASAAAEALAQEDAPKYESIALQAVVTAQLLRSNGPKAVTAANGALSAAQKARDLKVEGASWLAVATARHVSGGSDAKEAVQRARATFQEVGSRPDEAAALILLAQIELTSNDAQAASAAARDALSIARETDNPQQSGSALEALVEALLAQEEASEALEEAEKLLKTLKDQAQGRPCRGVVTCMCGVLLAESASKGVEAALAKARSFTVELRETGDKRGEAKMLHKLSTMTAVAPEALNSAQVALQLAQQVNDATLEAAIKSTLTDIYVARGKIEKAPLRKTAMKALGDLAKALENRDAELFRDAAKYLDSFYNALKQEDVELALSRAMGKDPAGAMEFLKEHGTMLADAKPSSLTKGHTVKPVPPEMFYYGFRIGGLAYGPRYRVNKPAYKTFNFDQTAVLSVVELADVSDAWERDLAYNPSLMDGLLQSTSAMGYDL